MNKNFANIALVLLAIDATLDLIFLNSLFGGDTSTNNDEDEHPLHGKRYVPQDNSYAMDKATGVEVGGVFGKEFIIVSDPYKEKVKHFWGSETEHLFVDVFSLRSARKYRVLFQESWIVED